MVFILSMLSCDFAKLSQKLTKYGRGCHAATGGRPESGTLLPFCAHEACASDYRRLVAARACALKGDATCINRNPFKSLVPSFLVNRYLDIKLYTRYPIVARALGLAAECAREQRNLAYKISSCTKKAG